MKEVLAQLLRVRFRISTQLYLAIGGAVALTVAASTVGLFSFVRVGNAQSQVNEGSVPDMVDAFGVAEYSSTITAAAPRLVNASTLDDFESISDRIDAAHSTFQKQLALLEERNSGDARFRRIRASSDTLITNIDTLKSQMTDFFMLTDQKAALQGELTDLRTQLDTVVAPAVDDQLFYTITGFHSLEAPKDPASEHFSETAFDNYRRLAELQADFNIATQLLASAFSLSDAPSIEPLKERFEAATGRIERGLSVLPESKTRIDFERLLTQLTNLGLGRDSAFDLLARELVLTARNQELLARNRDITLALLQDVDGLVSNANASVQVASMASTDAISTGRTLLLFISVFSVGGAILIAWLFVGRKLLRRLQLLSERMRGMASGDLEGTVDVGGQDEVADMAAALEVFRRHALEVQRLNLVEQLANDLQEKNVELESVLGELRVAQDQIVMREKLAALGELTAGVAHEIRNPLNFVNNFSEASESLLAELLEVLEEGGQSMDEEQQSLVMDISKDLTSNLERIRSHGERANRIVHDMLRMGAQSGEWQMVDINGLVDEYSRLAYHSLRATDPNFNVDIKQDFDPEVGALKILPQDLGRVFLNIVGNSCHAVEEKRRSLAEAGSDEPFFSTLLLKTRREENQVEISVKDNGHGIPPDVVTKIFNPFFTTKPTNQGTGLGLAISSDIIREHGGSIHVNTVPGEFTEMVVTLPVKPLTESTDEQQDDALLQTGEPGTPAD